MEEIKKRTALADKEMESLATFGLHSKRIPFLHIEKIYQYAVNKVLSDPSVLIKAENQQTPIAPYPKCRKCADFSRSAGTQDSAIYY